MKIEQLTLREIRLRLVKPFETSFDRTEERRVLLVEALVDGVSGWAEATVDNDPFYNYETIETAWHITRDFLWPMVKGREFASAAEVYDSLARVRGHNMAKGGLETAVWDAEARQKGVPLWRLLGGTREEIPCGVSIGIKPTISELLDTVAEELRAGYQRIKIKIKRGKDVEPMAALRERFSRIRLMGDANCDYSPEDIPHLKTFERFFLMMLEQPLAYDDLYAHRALQQVTSTPICLDECIHSLAHARAAIEMGACKIINIKLGRVGGHTAARRIHDLCREQSVPVWCGGMLESGIGRAHNIAMSTLENFTLPGDVSASKRYWHEDVIAPEVEVSAQGTITAPERPGIGYEPKREMIERLAVRTEVLR
ncbi:MAG TPA: o-succinylbenzoate synthase [Candidatus Acidoferrales bacterium]|nr:o-succinylbenzoate synthase [Candidatus Acidoferrales bacterium]